MKYPCLSYVMRSMYVRLYVKFWFLGLSVEGQKPLRFH